MTVDVRRSMPRVFYDALADDASAPGMRLPDDSPYRELDQRVIELLPDGASVVELGCGAGRLAGQLMAAGRAPSYIGLDFAPRVLDVATSRVPAATFRLADLRSDPIPEAEVYVATEVMEHLDDDLAVLRRLPLGSTVILSVPSFDSASHVRHFPERGQALTRYSVVLAVVTEEYVALPRGGRFFHLLSGVVA